jgi:uncharacterized protein
MKKIADAGLVIAGLDPRDTHHAWAKRMLEHESPPWLVCEPVLTEIAASVGTAEPVLQMLQAGDLELAFSLDENYSQVLALVRKYRDQQMDLADACVVRMSELFADARVYTVDKRDFSVYRCHGRRVIPCVFPDVPD